MLPNGKIFMIFKEIEFFESECSLLDCSEDNLGNSRKINFDLELYIVTIIVQTSNID